MSFAISRAKCSGAASATSTSAAAGFPAAQPPYRNGSDARIATVTFPTSPARLSPALYAYITATTSTVSSPSQASAPDASSTPASAENAAKRCAVPVAMRPDGSGRDG
jgi:hypothetical protein